MRKKSFLVYICLLLVVIIFVTGSVNGAQPGSSTDPLVSKSYVDQKINEILNVLGQTTATPDSSDSSSTDSSSTDSPAADSSLTDEELLLKIDFLIGERLKSMNIDSSENIPNENVSENTSSDTYTPVEVQAGQTIFGNEGTEIILRRGKGQAVTSTDGIVDATSGSELVNGRNVTINHLLIIPRSDGRGVKVSTSAWFIVKGSYYIN